MGGIIAVPGQQKLKNSRLLRDTSDKVRMERGMCSVISREAGQCSYQMHRKIKKEPRFTKQCPTNLVTLSDDHKAMWLSKSLEPVDGKLQNTSLLAHGLA